MSENDDQAAESVRPRRRTKPTADPAETLTPAVPQTEEEGGEPAVWTPPVVSLAALADGEADAVATVAEALHLAGFLEELPADGETFRQGYARLRRYLGHGPSASRSGPDTDSLRWLSLRAQTFTPAG